MTKTVKLTLLAVLCAVLLSSCADAAEANAPTAELTDKRTDAALTVDADAALSEDDVTLIAHLVSLEAGDYPYTTQVCFAAMILNRLEDSGFPSTVRGVILECGDFASVNSGQVTGTLPEGYTVRRRYLEALKAVKAALDGADPTGGALYCSHEYDETLSYECGGMYFGT